MADIVKRITTAGIDTFTRLIIPTHQTFRSGFYESFTTGAQSVKTEKSTFEKIYQWAIVDPMKGWFDFVLMPSQLTPDEAAGMSRTFIPLAIGATALAQSADTLGQMLPFGADTTSIGIFEDKVWSRLGLTAATAATFQSPFRIGLNRNLDYYYNKLYRSQKLELPQAYDGVRYREFLTEAEWSSFEGDINTPKPIEEMTPEEISAWAAKAARAVNAVEQTNSGRFNLAMEWLGYKQEDINLQNRAAKHAPALSMLRQMAMRGFFDAKFMARAIFKGGFDDWAVEPTLNFLAYMAQEGVWTGYREAAQMSFRKGLIDEAELRSVLKRIHVPKMLEDPIVATQKAMMGHESKDLTTTQLLTAYSKGAISRTECKKELTNLGLTTANAEILIKTKESVTAPSARLPTLAQFSSALRLGIINEADFTAYLNSRGYDKKYIDMLLQIERAKYPTTKPMLTMSSLGKAYKEGVISETIFKQKLLAIGYSNEEAVLIKSIYDSENKISTASLSKAEILKAVGSKVIDMNEGAERLMRLGYSIEDIEILYQIQGKPIEDIV